jgi:hypothetical protein
LDAGLLHGGFSAGALLACCLEFVKASVFGGCVVEAGKNDTHVTWAGGIADDSAFYVRVHSPVVWVEVDCQGPGPLAGGYGATQGGDPTQLHVHSIIRTPNGNDYGKELLRQHHLTSPHHN